MTSAGNQRVLLSAFFLCAIAAYGWSAIAVYRAHHFSESVSLPSLQKASSLAPGNSEYHDLLCRGLLFASDDIHRALDECLRATKLNPYSSTYWLDTAQAYYSVGNPAATKAAVQKALTVDPTTPDTAWNVANFLLAQGDTSGALSQFRMVLRENPSLAPAVLNICWQTMHDTARIQGILPLNSEVYLEFIQLLLSSSETNAAHQVWLALMQSNAPLDFRHALFYVDHLMKDGNEVQAKAAWDQLQSKSPLMQAYSQPGNLITDGRLLQEILNAGFGWRYKPNPEIAVLLDNAESRAEFRSLRITYSSVGNDPGIYQYIPVEPNTRYIFSGWVKSENIQSANGPMLALVDAKNNGEVLASTEECLGTTPWHQVVAEFQTGPRTFLVRLSVLRQPENTRIEGRFWFDDLELRVKR